LQKTPASRYPDAAALADDLERFLKGEPVSARSETIIEQAWRRLRKRPLLATASTLTACLALFSALALTYLEPSWWLVSGWVLWITSATALYFLLPDHRGLALAGFCFLLLAHVGWQSAMPPQTPGGHPYQLGMAWVICSTVLFFLLPRSPAGLALAGFSSLVFGLVFIGITWQGSYVEFFLHPIGVATCCIVARLIAYAIGGDPLTAVFAGVTPGMLAYSVVLRLLYPYPDPWTHGTPISKVEWASLGSAIVSVLVSAGGAFLITSPRIRQWSINAGSRVVHPFAAVRPRLWLGLAAAPVAVCLFLVVGRAVWLWASNPELLTIKGENRFYSVVFSPDGKRLASTAARIGDPENEQLGPLVTVWDASRGQQLYTIQLNDAAAAFCAAFSPNGEWLAVATDNRETPVKLFSATTGRESIAFKGHTGGARSLAFSSDGKRLLTGSQDGTARIWDSATGKELLALPRQESWINGVAFNPDSTRLATCTIAGTVKLWDGGTGKELSTLTIGQNPVGIMDWLHNVAFSPDGTLLAAATVNAIEAEGVKAARLATVHVWEVATGKAVLNLHGDYVAFSRDGTRLVTATGRLIKIYDVASGREVQALRGHTENVYSVAFSPDGKHLASTSLDRTVRVWQLDH
jgi:WD40 repeat protein